MLIMQENMRRRQYELVFKIFGENLFPETLSNDKLFREFIRYIEQRYLHSRALKYVLHEGGVTVFGADSAIVVDFHPLANKGEYMNIYLTEDIELYAL